MKDFLGTIGEMLPEKVGQCRVKGCKNTWSCSGEQAVLSMNTNTNHSRMCDACYTIYKTLTDKEEPCSSIGCQGTWVWNSFQQLEAKIQKRTTPPVGFCAACREKQQKLGDLEIPCLIKSCKNTWTWRASSRLKEEKPPRRLCPSCYEKAKILTDIQLPCRLDACKNTWTWDRYAQLDHLASGQDLEHPPKKMCHDCFRMFNELKEKDMPCSTQGCQGTWKWLRFDQLEYELNHDKKDEMPQRRCASCSIKYAKLFERHLPCANRFCRNTVAYSKNQQFSDLIQGKNQDPEIYCSTCQKKLTQLKMSQRPCQVSGCTNYRDFLPEEQLEEMSRIHSGYSEVRCPSCEKFLKIHRTLALTCVECGHSFDWKPYEQLLTEKKVIEKPQYCSECTRNRVKQFSQQEVTFNRRLVIKIPTQGAWKTDRTISDLPVAINATLRQRAEESECRILLLGDEFFAQEKATWVPAFDNKFSSILASLTPCIVNVGMFDSSAEKCIKRLERDVTPYEPSLIVLSSLFADAYNTTTDQTMIVLIEKLKENGVPILLVIPPLALSPQDSEKVKLVSARNKWLVIAEQYSLSILDLHARLASVINRWVDEEGQLTEIGQQGIGNLLANEVSQYFTNIEKKID